MLEFAFPLGLAVILTFFHFYGGLLIKYARKYNMHIISFSAGMFITFIFVEMFPKLFEGINYIGKIIFALFLGGFVIFYLSEKYIYQNVKSQKLIKKDVSEFHILGFFLDHFTIGFFLILLSYTDVFLGFLVFIPLVFHMLASAITLHNIEASLNIDIIIKIILSGAVLIGAVVAAFLGAGLNVRLYYSLFAFVVGALFFIVLRDLLPKDKHRKPLLFIIGVGVATVLLVFAGI